MKKILYIIILTITGCCGAVVAHQPEKAWDKNAAVKLNGGENVKEIVFVCKTFSQSIEKNGNEEISGFKTNADMK